jgi:hypothetical protein
VPFEVETPAWTVARMGRKRGDGFSQPKREFAHRVEVLTRCSSQVRRRPFFGDWRRLERWRPDGSGTPADPPWLAIEGSGNYVS